MSRFGQKNPLCGERHIRLHRTVGRPRRVTTRSGGLVAQGDSLTKWTDLSICRQMQALDGQLAIIQGATGYIR